MWDMMFKKNLDEYSLRQLWKKLDEIEKARSWLLKYLLERMVKEVERVFQKFNQMNSQIQIKSFFVRYSTYFLLPFPLIMRRFEVIVTEISYFGKTIKMEEKKWSPLACSCKYIRILGGESGRIFRKRIGRKEKNLSRSRVYT